MTLDCGEDELRQYVERLGLTGISVLDANGRLVCEYSADSIGYTRLQTDLEAERVLAVIGHPQSTYVRRVQLTDGSFADAAVRSCADGRGAVLGWRHTGRRSQRNPCSPCRICSTATTPRSREPCSCRTATA